jgi:hypothetical protein
MVGGSAIFVVKEDVSTFQPNIALDRHCNGPLLLFKQHNLFFLSFPVMEPAPER